MKTPPKKSTFLYAFGNLFARPIMQKMFHAVTTDYEKVPTSGPVVICSNHVTMRDPIYLQMYLERQVFYMAKEELFSNPAIGWFLKQMGSFPIKRGGSDVNALEYAEKILSNGNTLGIFIEGTRSKTGALGKPKTGAIMLAHKMNATIVPACISVLEDPPAKGKEMYVKYGDALSLVDLGVTTGSVKELRDGARIVMSKIAKLKCEIQGKQIEEEIVDNEKCDENSD